MSEETKEYRIEGRPSTIFRTVKDKNNPYIIIDGRPINNKNLSFKAKGILTYLMSRPDGWEVSVADLFNHSTDGEDAIRSGLAELRAAGHMKYIQTRQKGRITGMLIEVYEIPDTSPHADFPDVEKPHGEKPDTVNPTQVLKTLSIKDSKNNITEKIVKDADKAVDHILKMEKESKGKSYTKLPEMFIPYGKAFCESTSIDYTKRLSMDWISTFSDWLTAGYTPEMIPQAVKECVEKGMPANSPRSIEWKMKDIKVRAFVKAQQRVTQEQDQAPSVIPASWQAIYDEGVKVPA